MVGRARVRRVAPIARAFAPTSHRAARTAGRAGRSAAPARPVRADNASDGRARSRTHRWRALVGLAGKNGRAGVDAAGRARAAALPRRGPCVGGAGLREHPTETDARRHALVGAAARRDLATECVGLRTRHVIRTVARRGVFAGLVCAGRSNPVGSTETIVPVVDSVAPADDLRRIVALERADFAFSGGRVAR